MKLYVKDGIVVATHDDWQDVPTAVYGDGVTVQQVAVWSGSPGDPAP